MTAAMLPTATAADYRLSVAPMMEWTDRHCRMFHRLLAPRARLYTEMVVADAAIHGKRPRLLGFDPAEQPVALQLGGSDPAKLALASRIGADYGYAEINLNVGCPSDRVQAGRFGACLMLEPHLVADCVAAMRAACAVPVTVKCRLGVDEQDDELDFRAFVEVVAAAGCDTFLVHARKAWLKGLDPKQNREIPPLMYERVYRLKAERTDLTVVLNGGLRNVEGCMHALGRVDGVMLGRAAYQDPRILQALHAQLYPEMPVLSDEMILSALEAYIDQQEIAPRHLGRHILGWFNGASGAKQWRRALSAGERPATAYAAMQDAVHDYSNRAA